MSNTEMASYKFEQIITGDDGQIMGFVYASGERFETWKRKRLQSQTPGNVHTYEGVFDSLEEAVAAVRDA